MQNELGIYDMSGGEVREWCFDRYAAYTEEDATNPQGPDNDSIKNYVVRGGIREYYYRTNDTNPQKVFHRENRISADRDKYNGLRLALSTEEQ